MAVENEIVRFVAEIELDAQDQAKFISALKDSEEQCEALRKSISDTGNQMTKLRAEGKENSKEFLALSKTLKENKDKLKELTKSADSYSAALSINQMSINQLNKHARTLRTALSAMHKEANPNLWNKYNTELIRTERRLKELQIGAKSVQKPMLSLSNLFGNLKTPSAWGFAAAAGLNLAKSAIETLSEQTQVWGDKWGEVQTAMSAGWSHLLRWVSSGNREMLASTKEVIQAAVEAKRIRDGLFEKENSLKIAEAQAGADIAEQQAIVSDSSYTPEERIAAQEQILKIEKELMTVRQDIAQDQMNAALLDLKEVGLNEQDLNILVDKYNVNKDIIAQAQETIKKEEELEKLRKEADKAAKKSRNKSTDSKEHKEWEAAVAKRDDLEKELKDNFDQSVSYTARILKQYDMSNDELIQKYVEGRINFINAQSEYNKAEAAQARRRGTLINQIEEESYNNELSSAEKHYNEQLNSLKLSLLNREITETEYKAKSSALEISFLNQKKAINQTYGLDVTEIEGQIYDKRLGLQNQFNDKFLSTDENFTKLLEKQRAEANKSIEKLLAEMNSEVDKLQGELEQDSIDEFDRLLNKANTGIVTKDAKIAKSDADFDTEMADLESLHNLKLISEEEYLARKSELVKSHTQEVMQIETEGWNNALGVADQILGQMSNAISSAREAEYASLDAWKAKELAAAGDNAEKREQIEAEYEAKKLDIQKKYADIDMGIQIAKAIAAGALAIMQGFAQLGPVAGGVMAALITATTAAQIATIVAQRNAIKNASAESASASTATQSSTSNVAVGFSDGGYTGDGGRTEVAGVVHRGEYVVPQPELKIPYVQSLVAAIESKRRQRTSRNALPGFAEGGYTDVMTNQQNLSDTRILNQIYFLLTKMSKQPIKAYTVLSEMEAKQDMRNRFKRMTSLRRN